MTAQEQISNKKTKRFMIGWKTRHLGVLLFGAILTYGFLELRANWSPMHQWNRAAGDAGVVLVSLAMAIGPLTRLWRGARRFIPWRREFGIWGVVLSAIHTGIILVGWVDLDLMRLFGFAFIPQIGRTVMVQHGFGLANAIGIMALVYGIVLAASSNNYSQRVFGGSVWKFLQQSAYVLWVLVVLHTAYFVYLHFLDFHRPIPAPNPIQVPFAILVGTVALLQCAAFVDTWRSGRRNGRLRNAAGNAGLVTESRFHRFFDVRQ